MPPDRRRRKLGHGRHLFGIIRVSGAHSRSEARARRTAPACSSIRFRQLRSTAGRTAGGLVQAAQHSPNTVNGWLGCLGFSRNSRLHEQQANTDRCSVSSPACTSSCPTTLLNPMTDAEHRDRLEVSEDRHDRSSTVITTQMPTKAWHEALVDPTIADAICDRLVHNAHVLKLGGPSVRRDKALQSEKSATPTPADPQTLVAALRQRSSPSERLLESGRIGRSSAAECARPSPARQEPRRAPNL
jgi:hypothetical protein